MAATDFAALSAAQKKVWAAEIWKAGTDQNFWMSNGFVSTGMNTPIQRVTDLTETERGSIVAIQLVSEMQEDGVVGDNMLTGNEEPLFNDLQEIRIDLLRHGTRSKGRMSEQKTVIVFRQTAREKLGFWIGDKLDELMFLTASGVSYNFRLDGTTRPGTSQLPSLAFAADVTAPSSGREFFAGAATSTATLTAADKMTWNLLVSAQAYAKRKRMRPIRSGGRDYYAVVMSTEQARDLKTDPNYQTVVSRAGPRGDTNPLFRGALAVVDGLVLYDHQKVRTTLGLASGFRWGAGGTIHGAQALLMGAQALAFATIGQTMFEEAEVTDYRNRPGLSVGRMIGMLKPAYKSIYDNNTRQDFGVLSIYTAAGATV
jgi:N4-gp56 family major capsid protein